MANEEIRSLLKAEKIPYWRIAEILGVCENTIVRKLRHEMSESDKNNYLEAITKIKAQKETV